jgi:hypothetical protein
MTTFLSEFAKCWRCQSHISDRSAYAVLVLRRDDVLFTDIIMSKNLSRNDVAIHMGGDRECRRELSGFHGKILKKLELPTGCDTSILERL